MSERIQKVLAQLGLGSRREIEKWIKAGRIQINNVTAKLGDQIIPTDSVHLDGRKIRLTPLKKQQTRILIYNKPEGEICTRSDPEGRPTIFEKLPPLKNQRWIVIGRLDINSSGLLLFTNDGELAHQLMHPSFDIEREYAVRLLGQVTESMIKRLIQGVELEDGKARFTHIQFTGGEGANRWYRVTLTEGRHREVRRLWESQNIKVSRLVRIRYGTIELPRSLACGRYIELEPHEFPDLS